MLELRTLDAVALLPAVALGVARDLGVRALIIKGEGLALQGLRPPRVSGDVDIWVSPSDFERFIEEMKARAWFDRDEKVLAPLTGPASVFTVHSITLQGLDWPIALDVHRCYPGFFTPPARLFDEVWAERDFVKLGEHWCAVPKPTDHWLLAMLHSLRDGNLSQVEQLETSAQAFSAELLEDLRARAILLGAVEPLRSRLERLGEEFPPPDPEARRLLAEWHLATSTAPHGDFAHLAELLRARGRTRAIVIWRAIFPPEKTFRLFHEVPPGRAGLFRAYAQRWIRGIAAVPRMLLYAWRIRRIT